MFRRIPAGTEDDSALAHSVAPRGLRLAAALGAGSIVRLATAPFEPA
jgi:hypothetical protein